MQLFPVQTRRAVVAACAAWLLVSSGLATAQNKGGRAYSEITGTGQSLVRIAIPPVLDGGGAGGTVAPVAEGVDYPPSTSSAAPNTTANTSPIRALC